MVNNGAFLSPRAERHIRAAGAAMNKIHGPYGQPLPVAAQYLHLCLLASAIICRADGRLEDHEGPLGLNDLHEETRLISAAELPALMQTLIEAGLVAIAPNGAYFLPHFIDTEEIRQ